MLWMLTIRTQVIEHSSDLQSEITKKITIIKNYDYNTVV
jgi:hypothetical protein